MSKAKDTFRSGLVGEWLSSTTADTSLAALAPNEMKRAHQNQQLTGAQPAAKAHRREAAIPQNSEQESFLSEVLKNPTRLRGSVYAADKEFVLAVVTKHHDALVYAAATLKADKDVVLAAVTHNGKQLHHASAALLSDRQVVLAAVNNDGNALYYGSEELRSDSQVVLAACLLYTSPSPRDRTRSRMPSSA